MKNDYPIKTGNLAMLALVAARLEELCIDRLPGHLNYGSVLEERVKVVLGRMQEISNI